MTPSTDKLKLFAKFQGEEILQEFGRLLFSLLKAFTDAGYQITLLDNLEDDKLGKYGRLVYSLAGLTRADAPPADTEEDWIYLYDRPDPALTRRPWRKQIQVRYDLFSPYWRQEPVIMPFPLHPAQNTADLEQRLQHCRSLEKRMRIFFSGDSEGYRQNRVRYPRPKLPRLEILDTLRQRLPDEVLVIGEQSQMAELAGSDYLNRCVLVDTGKIWVDEQEWLPSLARSDFFLSPPGIVMPMCHNLVEAMAVGSIPITNYPEWFDPDLVHGENCLVFDDHDDLIRKVRMALSMEREEIARLRANVLDYYQTHLRSGVFIRRIEASPDPLVRVLLITERNMARNPKKLNRNSVLIRGTGEHRKPAWFERLLRRH